MNPPTKKQKTSNFTENYTIYFKYEKSKNGNLNQQADNFLQNVVKGFINEINFEQNNYKSLFKEAYHNNVNYNLLSKNNCINLALQSIFIKQNTFNIEEEIDKKLVDENQEKINQLKKNNYSNMDIFRNKLKNLFENEQINDTLNNFDFASIYNYHGKKGEIRLQEIINNIFNITLLNINPEIDILWYVV